MIQIDIVVLQETPSIFLWPLGAVHYISGDPATLAEFVSEKLKKECGDVLIFWDMKYGTPEPDFIRKLVLNPVDIWHAGLRLGTEGLPGIIDFVCPAWMLNCDPSGSIEASSWRISMGACMVRTEVLRQHGFIRQDFCSLEGAALEWGYRCITNGAIIRHNPNLLPETTYTHSMTLPFEDELRFIYSCFDRKWASWALFRVLVSGYVTPISAVKAWLKTRNFQKSIFYVPYTSIRKTSLLPAFDDREKAEENPQVSILIPTIDRYSYLQTLLNQLREQSIHPLEIIVVDQTPQEQRNEALYESFSDLPLRVFLQSEAGQCSSRNIGLQTAKGDYILFLDDDIEIPTNFIASHLANLHRYNADVSSGIADEVGGESLAENFTFIRISDVFPAGNTLIRRSVLKQSGLFDLAYEHGARADGDLGMRVYLSGGLMILNPSARVLHHHAPRGGLRTHKARIITRASSRQSLRQRHLPSATEIYLAKRFLTSRQLREMLYLRILSTFSLHISGPSRILKILIGIALLPDTLSKLHRVSREAAQMLKRYPQIPPYSDS